MMTGRAKDVSRSTASPSCLAVIVDRRHPDCPQGRTAPPREAKRRDATRYPKRSMRGPPPEEDLLVARRPVSVSTRPVIGHREFTESAPAP